MFFRKSLIITGIVTILILAGIGWFWHMDKQGNGSYQEGWLSERSPENQESGKVSDIQGLVEGEFQFPDINTSDWQSYRDDSMGFEVRIPKDWKAEKKDRPEQSQAYCHL